MNPLVLLSGGLDSMTSLAAVLTPDIERAGALTVDYQQTNGREIRQATQLCEWWGVEWWIRQDKFLGGSDPLREIPARNVIFLARALELALVRGFNSIVIGAEPDAVYSDSSVEFIERVSAAFQTFGVKVIAPVKRLEDKQAVLRMALDRGVPLHIAHSSLTSEIDGRCKTSARFLAALGKEFPAMEPSMLLAALSLIHRSRTSGDPLDLAFGIGGSFKTIAALFTLASLPESANTCFEVYTTGSWGRALEAVSLMFFGGKFKFDIRQTRDVQLLSQNILSTKSEQAQWGYKQAFCRLPRPHKMPSVSVPVVQGHLRDALLSLGYRVTDEPGAVRLKTAIEAQA